MRPVEENTYRALGKLVSLSGFVVRILYRVRRRLFKIFLIVHREIAV